MTQTIQRATAPILLQAPAAAPLNLAQHRAIQFVSAMIASGDSSAWNSGYIHGLIQALSMAGIITVDQACKLEDDKTKAEFNHFNRRAVGGAA